MEGEIRLVVVVVVVAVVAVVAVVVWFLVELELYRNWLVVVGDGMVVVVGDEANYGSGCCSMLVVYIFEWWRSLCVCVCVCEDGMW